MERQILAHHRGIETMTAESDADSPIFCRLDGGLDSPGAEVEFIALSAIIESEDSLGRAFNKVKLAARFQIETPTVRRIPRRIEIA